MTEDVFDQSTRALTTAILAVCQRHNFTQDDTVATASVTLLNVLNTALGPLGCIERLRDLADIIERDAMAEIARMN